MGIGRIAFLGTGAFGVPLLSRVLEQADDLVVVSQPDRPAGRRLQLRATPVAALARERGIPVMTPHRLRSDEARRALRDYAPDGLLLVAYGQLVPQDMLDIAERPPLNVHPSLLPRHRGAAPVAGTILAGDRDGALPGTRCGIWLGDVASPNKRELRTLCDDPAIVIGKGIRLCPVDDHAADCELTFERFTPGFEIYRLGKAAHVA